MQEYLFPFDSYFTNKKPRNGEIISMLTKDICKKNSCSNVLFIRTPTTGGWLESLKLAPELSITRILYQTGIKYRSPSNATIEMSQKEYVEYMHTLRDENKRFDLICIDPFHEYDTSYRDFNLCLSILSDNGIILCHDCAPPILNMTSPHFIQGSWSGVTYIAFIMLAYENDGYSWRILDTDTGIGILKKGDSQYLKQDLDKEKQKQLKTLFENEQYDESYNFFRNNGEELIGLISRQEQQVVPQRTQHAGPRREQRSIRPQIRR
jgi:hypothetical protein